MGFNVTHTRIRIRRVKFVAICRRFRVIAALSNSNLLHDFSLISNVAVSGNKIQIPNIETRVKVFVTSDKKTNFTLQTVPEVIENSFRLETLNYDINLKSSRIHLSNCDSFRCPKCEVFIIFKEFREQHSILRQTF